MSGVQSQVSSFVCLFDFFFNSVFQCYIPIQGKKSKKKSERAKWKYKKEWERERLAREREKKRRERVRCMYYIYTIISMRPFRRAWRNRSKCGVIVSQHASPVFLSLRLCMMWFWLDLTALQTLMPWFELDECVSNWNLQFVVNCATPRIPFSILYLELRFQGLLIYLINTSHFGCGRCVGQKSITLVHLNRLHQGNWILEVAPAHLDLGEMVVIT